MTRSKTPRRVTRFLEALRFNDQGLLPAVIQDAGTKQVLTLCFMNRAALRKSLTTGLVHVYRRSQKRLMLKGETSGHVQRIRGVLADCEGKSLVLLVRQRVAACHAGYMSCYFRKLTATGSLKASGGPVFDPSKVYARR